MTEPPRRRPPRTPMPAPPELGASPRVAALAGAGAGAGAPALRAFWAEVAERGTPLVEDRRVDGARLVTFLWRDRHGAGPGTRQVVLIANRLTDPSVWAHSVLERLPGTDVWHRSYWLDGRWRGTYQVAPEDGLGGGSDAGGGLGARGGAAQRWRGLDAVALPDPLNPITFPERGGDPASVAVLADAPADRWPARGAAVARAGLAEHAVPSAALGGTRRVWTHGTGGDVLLLLDGDDWAGRLDAPAILDGLGLPLTTIMVDAGPRRDAELAPGPARVAFLADELLPWARGALGAGGRAFVAGQSLGGLLALTLALERPGTFAGVLAQSASLWWAPPGDDRDGAAIESYMNERFAAAGPALPPTRFALQAGTLEWVLRGQHRALRDTLRAAGHAVDYDEPAGGHEALCWRVGLAEALPGLIAATQAA